MGVVRNAGYCVVKRKAEEVIAIMRTKKAARARLRRERKAGVDCYLAELFYSDGLLEGKE